MKHSVELAAIERCPTPHSLSPDPALFSVAYIVTFVATRRYNTVYFLRSQLRFRGRRKTNTRENLLSLIGGDGHRLGRP